MMVSIRDHRVLATVLPSDIDTYLRGSGWTAVAEQGAFSAWAKTVAGEPAELEAPRHPEWRDYGRRVQELLSYLATIEGRSELDILRDIRSVAYDVVRVVARGDGNADGSIPLAEGISLASAGKGSMLSAACATVQKRRAFQSRKPPRAAQFAEGLRLGQSEHGSYVVTVLSPIPQVPAPAQIVFPLPDFDPPLPEVPFERQVTRTLATALTHLRLAATAAAGNGDLESFETSVEHGVSADLCESVALLRNCASVAELEVRIGWALVQPLTTEAPSHTVFPRELIAVIGDAGRMLREREPVEDYEFEGPVIQVSRPEETLQGKATMHGLVDGAPRKLVVELWGEDWKKAIKAMGERERLRLRCTGTLVRLGRAFVLNDARGVQLLDDDGALVELTNAPI